MHARPKANIVKPHFLFLLGALAPCAHSAGPTGYLNDTGQTSCYDAADAAVACDAGGGPNPRQDARFGRDAAGMAKTGGGTAGFDFTKMCMSGELAGGGGCPSRPAVGVAANNWACTKDNYTHLIWSIATIGDTTWADATTTHPDRYNRASRCGFDSGWRAPTRRELLSIVHHGITHPSIDRHYFPDTVADWYWGAEVYALAPSKAWVVNFDFGNSYAISKTGTVHVRLVRSLVPPLSAAVTDHGDGTVTDRITGLMWDKCSWGQSNFTDCSGGAASEHIWPAAVGVAVTANGSSHRGYTDWRLPNRSEMESLVKMDAFHPAIDSTPFPNTLNWYWTSTTLALDPALAWRLSFADGYSYGGHKTDKFHVRLVRGGQFASVDSMAAVIDRRFGIGDDTADGEASRAGRVPR